MIRSINFGIEESNVGEWLDPGMLLSSDRETYHILLSSVTVHYSASTNLNGGVTYCFPLLHLGSIQRSHLDATKVTND
jgi:hypothetical protein